MRRSTLVTIASTALLIAAACAAAQDATIKLHVDAREAPRRIFHAQLTIPVSPGPVTLFYPQWLPGNHRPTGPINNLVELRMKAGTQAIAWQRDEVNMYAFHCTVPRGVQSLDVSFDYVTPSHGPGRFDPVSTDQLMVFNWNLVTLYPAGKPAADYTVAASLEMPEGWKFGTALPVTGQTGNTVRFAPASLVTLVDSPVLAGRHYRAIPLPSAGAPPQELDIAADSEAALELPEETLEHYQRLVAEAGALFGAHHYRAYHFLLALSDLEGSSGLEHHESSDNRAPERALIDADLRKLLAGLLPHEFAHSWNGKYRRPAGLATPDYQQPMRGDLLWVYEGLTSYLGEVLTARSGLYTPEQFRENLAGTAAGMDNEAGRAWRSLEDTAVSVQTLSETSREWNSVRRSLDYYPESALIWLEADTIIRRETKRRSSLDDFCREFFGGPSGPPAVKPYTLDDLIAAMTRVTPYDWRTFFKTRVYEIAPRAPLGGIEQGGWRLVYNDTPNELRKAAEERFHFLDLSTSLGMTIARGSEETSEATIADVVPAMPAAKAGISPGMRLVAINGRRWSPEVLTAALRANHSPLELLVENVGFYKTYAVDYGNGLRSPHLTRNTAVPDLLEEIIKPRAAGGSR